MLRLTLQTTGPIPIEAESVRPDALQSLALAEIAKLPAWQGNHSGKLADFFAIEGDAADGVVEVIGDCSHVKRLGENMAGGHLIVRGSVGMHLGAGMTGGSIDVYGSADDWLGAQMAGGEIRVRGHAGDSVGSAYRGGSRGMTGGSILIEGHAGDEVGAYMRRGLIAIGGHCGSFAGVSMIAGTILIGGNLGAQAGAGMKRGTIVTLGTSERMSPGFADNGPCEPTFLALYARHLKSRDFELPKLTAQCRYIRYGGDRVSLGRGEILQRV